MSIFVIEGGNNILDAEGHPYRLLKDGVKIFGGCWADCLKRAFVVGKDGEDTLTSGLIDPYINEPIECARRKRIESAKACGFSLDRYGNIEN